MTPRIVSTLPTATEIVYALGLGDSLAGVSHECNYPAAATRLPRVTRTDFDYDAASSIEIENQVQSSLHQHRSLYQLDEALLQRIKPTHLITQQLCEVCAVTPDDIQAVIRELPIPPALISLQAHSLTDILSDINHLASDLGAPAAGRHLTARLTNTIDALLARSRSLPRRRVVCIEWLEPFYSAGHWVPEMVELAGGQDVLARPGDKSRRLSLEEITAAKPDVIIFMPCGFPISKTRAELSSMPELNAETWIVDAPAFFSQSGPRVISQGLSLLASILHPDIFGRPDPERAILAL